MHRLPVHAARAILALSIAAASGPSSAQDMDTTHRTAIISAFPPEIAALQDGLTDTATQTLNGVSFTTGQLSGQPVVMFMSGVSMVNAAMTTQLALDHFTIDRILFSGIAGGVDPDLAIGDVVIPGQWGQYLQGVAARETGGAFAIPPWMTSDFPNFGMTFTIPFGVMADGLSEPDMRFWFPVDPDLLALAQRVSADVTLSDCTPEQACLTEAPRIVVGGNGVSGAMFVDNAALRDHAFATFDAQVLDMESAAVAQVAFANQTPFIAFRSLSDLAGGGGGANEMGTFMALAATNAATVIRAVVAALD